MRAQTDGTDGLKVQTRRHISPTISQIPDLRNVDRQSFFVLFVYVHKIHQNSLVTWARPRSSKGWENYTGGITSPARDVKNDGSKS